jgi:hypothetical protein
MVKQDSGRNRSANAASDYFYLDTEPEPHQNERIPQKHCKKLLTKESLPIVQQVYHKPVSHDATWLMFVFIPCLNFSANAFLA